MSLSLFSFLFCSVSFLMILFFAFHFFSRMFPPVKNRAKMNTMDDEQQEGHSGCHALCHFQNSIQEVPVIHIGSQSNSSFLFHRRDNRFSESEDSISSQDGYCSQSQADAYMHHQPGDHLFYQSHVGDCGSLGDGPRLHQHGVHSSKGHCDAVARFSGASRSARSVASDQCLQLNRFSRRVDSPMPTGSGTRHSFHYRRRERYADVNTTKGDEQHVSGMSGIGVHKIGATPNLITLPDGVMPSERDTKLGGMHVVRKSIPTFISTFDDDCSLSGK